MNNSHGIKMEKLKHSNITKNKRKKRKEKGVAFLSIYIKMIFHVDKLRTYMGLWVIPC